MLSAWGLYAVLVTGLGTPPPDQQPATRAEALRQAREAKQAALRPYEPSGLERVMHLAEDQVMPVLRRDGIYARFGSLTTGSGTALGAGYRDRSLVRGLGSLDLWAAASFTGYWAVEARGHYPLRPGDTLALDARLRQYSSPREEFFGIGPDSRRRDETIYTERGTTLDVDVAARPFRHLRLGAGLGVERPRIESGGDSGRTSIEARFDDDAAPGIAADPTFARTRGFVEYDDRRPLNARRGGLYRLDVARYTDRDGGRYTFTRATLDLRRYVSFLAERRVIATRLWVATTEPADGARVPFYLQPSLGGNDTLRGFRAVRFRGPHAILLQAEYRWEIWSALEAAIFYDAGKVALRRADLDFRDLEHDYGFGFRFNTDDGVVMRVDAAFGSRDGRHLHVVFGGIF